MKAPETPRQAGKAEEAAFGVPRLGKQRPGACPGTLTGRGQLGGTSPSHPAGCKPERPGPSLGHLLLSHSRSSPAVGTPCCLSEPQFPHPQNGCNGSTFLRGRSRCAGLRSNPPPTSHHMEGEVAGGGWGGSGTNSLKAQAQSLFILVRRTEGHGHFQSPHRMPLT